MVQMVTGNTVQSFQKGPALLAFSLSVILFTTEEQENLFPPDVPIKGLNLRPQQRPLPMKVSSSARSQILSESKAHTSHTRAQWHEH